MSKQWGFFFFFFLRFEHYKYFLIIIFVFPKSNPLCFVLSANNRCFLFCSSNFKIISSLVGLQKCGMILSILFICNYIILKLKYMVYSHAKKYAREYIGCAPRRKNIE